MASIGLYLSFSDTLVARVVSSPDSAAYTYIAVDFASSNITLYTSTGKAAPIIARQLAAVLLRAASEAEATLNPPPPDAEAQP